MSTTDYGTILATMIAGARMRREEIARIGELSRSACNSGDSIRIATVDASMVFQAWRGVECLTGACSAALELGSSPSESDINSSIKTLLKPKSTQRKEIINQGQKKDVYELAAISNPMLLSLSKGDREIVDSVYKATLDCLKGSMFEIRRLAKLVQGPRHSYAHNYRFIPLRCPEPTGGFLHFNTNQNPIILGVQGNPSMIGVLDDKARAIRLIITDDDRDELITKPYVWAEIEGWIYQNMINTIENGRSILPGADSFLFTLERRLVEEYESLRSRLGHISYFKDVHGWSNVEVSYNPSREI